MKRPLGAATLAVLWVAIAVQAEERILHFHSRILVEPDSSVTVREDIRVRVEGNQIKHGIYRDFPTDYVDTHGTRYQVGFYVKSVFLDGTPEPHHLARQENGTRVYIGSRDRMAPSGDHLYSLTYTTTRQLGFFEKHDELYWNVTGNGWLFPMDTVSAEVIVPEAASQKLFPLVAYTGPQGARGTDFRANVDEARHAQFVTTKPLGAGEGLTIVVGWPKGFVQVPGMLTKLRWFLMDNPGPAVGVFGLLVILLYYYFSWKRVGQDPTPGAIFPLYKPPADLEPDHLRYIDNMAWDDKIFAAAILQLAVKGHVQIFQEGSTYKLLRKKNGKGPLSPEAFRFLNTLLGSSDVLEMKQTNYATLQAARGILQGSLEGKSAGVFFHKNSTQIFIGVLLSAAVAILEWFAEMRSARDPVILVYLVAIVWALMVARCGYDVVKAFLELNSYRDTSAKRIGRLLFFGIIFLGLLLLVVKGWSFVVMNQAGIMTSILVVMMWMNYLFAHLLPAPTVAGRKLMDSIEGFRMFLGISEKDRMNLLNPPERTPELFEKFLPYALALDVEQNWSEQFTSVLAKVKETTGTAYYPGWYSGSRWSHSDLAGFSSSLGNSFTSVISSSATPPGQSSGGGWSGGGGGGSSGGGGGGGGGGGW